MSEYSFNGYQSPVVFKKNRGGSCIYVKNGIIFTVVSPPNPTEDSVWISIRTSNNISRLYGCIYRSPNSTNENNEKLIANIEWAEENYVELVLLGDFNMPSIDWSARYSSDDLCEKFIDAVDDAGLEQLIEECTRYRHGQNPSILDLLLTNIPNAVQKLEINEPFGKCDHVRIEFTIGNAYIKQSGPKMRYNFRKMDKQKFLELAEEENWEEILSQADFDKAYEDFASKIGDIFEKTVPKFNPKDRKTAPWSNKLVKKLSKKKRKKWDRYRYTKNVQDHAAYKEAEEKFNDVKESAIRRYEQNIIANKNTNRKRYYDYINKKDKYMNRKITLKKDGIKYDQDEKCADILNNFFASVFTQGQSVANNLPSEQSNIPNIDAIEITESKVRDKISSLDVNKSIGPDGIPPLVIKELPDFFAPKITKILLRSYHEGHVPALLKTSFITPLHKSGSREEPANYRPISLTPIIAKLMESIFRDHIEEHLRKNNLVSPRQHGFCKGKSTTTNMIDFWDDISLLSELSTSISIIYTDLRKAFDSVPHDLLMYKVRRMGITGKIHDWLKNFLEVRKQKVSINGSLSEAAAVVSGVPQGGVLSGTLFSIYINDLPTVIKHCMISLYADDAKLYYPIGDENSIQLVQQDINQLVAWCSRWRLNLNSRKCFQIQYNPKSFARSFNPIYFIENEEIAHHVDGRDLGITISSDLKFHKHVNEVCRKANAEIHRIRRTFRSRTPKFLADMYKIFVRSQLEYCVEVWNPCFECDVQKMEKVQNRMTKLLNHGNYLSPAERNSMLGITSHETRRKRGDLIAMYKNVNNEKLFKLRGPTRLRGHDKTMNLPVAQNLIRKHSLACRRVSEWNGLPSHVIASDDVNTFKTNLDAFWNL